MIRFLFLVLVLGISQVIAQDTRTLINEGVELYNKKEYSESEINFLKGKEKNPESFEASFNLGDAYYKQQKYDKALQAFSGALEQVENETRKAKVYHNMGNSLLKSQKVKESIEAYKNALKYNPDDEETKYNLSYALSLLKNQNKQQNQQDNKDQNKNQDKQDNKNQDQQKKDQNKQDQQEKSKSGEDQQTQQDNLKQPQKNEISKEEAQRILEALKNNEKELQKKIRKMKGTPIKTEKDW